MLILGFHFLNRKGRKGREDRKGQSLAGGGRGSLLCTFSSLLAVGQARGWVRASCGISLPKQAIKLCLGDRLDAPSNRFRYSTRKEVAELVLLQF
jgi:hypothetical protein